MAAVVPLAEAAAEHLYGAKAVGLGAAARAGIPVPPGIALSGAFTDAVAADDPAAVEDLLVAAKTLPPPLAVRSSCVDEDGAAASFAGQHLTLLNIPSADQVPDSVREIWWSANSDSAIAYRQRVSLVTRPSMGVVVQSLLTADVAGVMFTRNPVTGGDERVVEATWGLGETVVAGMVIPDHFRISRDGAVVAKVPGRKTIAIRRAGAGGTVEEQLPQQMWEQLCLDDGQLRELAELAHRCEEIYGPGRDIEWAFAGGELFLLQCRAVTVAGGTGTPAQRTKPLPGVEAVAHVPLLSGLDPEELTKVARAFKIRRFAAGDVITKEGGGAAAFFVIDSGTAAVTVGGEQRAQLGPGDSFGEIALIDEGARTATVTAVTDLVCRGLTVWEFKPLVNDNPGLAWKLLQSLARRLREAQLAER
ncbi:MAG TPA: PEP/pyruvate-binding domain-containing protein [Mycobacteriales bacterium]|nr:PEP/pyruvate-binding domain-containing protein [Mycobacteriales bacterium]